MNGNADFVFIGAGFRFDGKSDGRLGKLRGRIINRRTFIAESFARRGFLQFGNRADVSRMKLADFGELLALNNLDMLEAFREVAIVIDERGVVLQDAAFDLEIVDAAREEIGKRLKDKEGKRLAVVVPALDAVALAAGLLETYLRVLIGVGEDVSEEGEQAGSANVMDRGGHQDGEDFFGDDGLSNGGDEVVDGDGTFPEKLFHHFVVAFGNHLYKLFVGFLGFVGERGGNFFDGGLAITVGLIDVRFHGHQIDHPAESSFRPDGQLERNHIAAEDFLERFHGALEAGEFAVHPGENKGAGNVVFGAIVPNFFRGDLGADMSVNGNERGISSDERGLRFGNEGGIAWEIDKVNFDFLG